MGMGELVLILLILVVLLGASRLPQLGDGLGKGIRSFRKAFGGEDDPKAPPTDPDQLRKQE